jgi:hypothetical protein
MTHLILTEWCFLSEDKDLVLCYSITKVARMIFNRVLKIRGTGRKTDVKWNLLRNLKKEYNIFRPAPRHYIKCISLLAILQI